MRIREAQKNAVYNAIADPIMDLRIGIARRELSHRDIDRLLCQLERTIWKQVATSLGVAE